MHKDLLFQRCLSVAVGILLFAFVGFLLIAVTQYSPMADALLLTDQKWIAVQEAATARSKAVAVAASADPAILSDSAVQELLRLDGVFWQLSIDRNMSPFSVDRAGDFDRTNELVESAILHAMPRFSGTSRAGVESASTQVATAIRAYNASATAYNAEVVKFPRRYISTPFGFIPKPLLRVP